mmetsp:Transcript_11483/g.29880  ORF Transcript_11483/g.29880 Transcript_11483/m.29880 type:complete len:278 (+) Transcript_11483:870-1703(+)
MAMATTKTQRRRSAQPTPTIRPESTTPHQRLLPLSPPRRQCPGRALLRRLSTQPPPTSRRRKPEWLTARLNRCCRRLTRHRAPASSRSRRRAQTCARELPHASARRARRVRPGCSPTHLTADDCSRWRRRAASLARTLPRRSAASPSCCTSTSATARTRSSSSPEAARARQARARRVSAQLPRTRPTDRDRGRPRRRPTRPSRATLMRMGMMARSTQTPSTATTMLMLRTRATRTQPAPANLRRSRRQAARQARCRRSGATCSRPAEVWVPAQRRRK